MAPLILIVAAGAAHIATAVFLVVAASYTPLFDASPNVVASSSPLLRWDAFHFDHVAHDGYRFEHDWAFLPGLPFILRSVARIANMPGTSPSTMHAFMLLPLSLLSTHDLYELSVIHLRSAPLARLATILALLPASPVTLKITIYAEPWFTAAAYRGMLFAARKQWLGAACSFALAASLRSNGILLAGFLLWGMLIEPFLLSHKLPIGKLLQATLLTSLVFAPFVHHNFSAYVSFCHADSASPANRVLPYWCDSFPPSVYAYVQAKYWNVGPFRYWSLSQLPNFILATPILALLFLWSTTHLCHAVPFWSCAVSMKTASRTASDRWTGAPRDPFFHPSVTPHAIHALITATMLLVTAHTQIVLRLAAAMPATYWAAAWLYWRVSERERKVTGSTGEHSEADASCRSWGKYYLIWSTVWGSFSIVLWAAFLPPA